jgi:hypothetical protein
MIETYPSGVEAKGSFSLPNRIYLQTKGFPVFLDRPEDAAAVCRDNGVAFVRGRIPGKYWNNDLHPSTLMFRMMAVGRQFRVQAIPGIHDVTAEFTPLHPEDPYLNFRNILTGDFRSRSPYVNTFLIDANPELRFSEVQYDPPVESGKIVDSHLREIRGDRYRLALWAGFTGNHSLGLTSSEDYSRAMTYGYASVEGTPADLVERFIIINTNEFPDQVEDRIDFYRADTEGLKIPHSVKVLNSNYQRIAIL